MSRPPASTVKTPPEEVELPDSAGLPMSLDVHGAGKLETADTVTLATADVPLAPAASNATAVRSYVPAGTLDHE